MQSLNLFRRGSRVLAILFLAGWMLPALSAQPSLENLGNGRYKLGEILIDRNAGEFSVEGRVIRDEQQPLLEYLAVKKNGLKGYEAVFELNTTAGEFNLACILIGLDAEHAVLPEYHFDDKPLAGDQVELFFAWKEGEQVKRFRAEELFLVDGKPVKSGEWVYTGSTVLPDGRYLAEDAGTLIGFIHDQDSIIEHRQGIGLGRPGQIAIDPALLPPGEIPVRLTVRNLHRTLPGPENQAGRATHEKP